MKIGIGMIYGLFFYGMVTGLIIEFLITPEDKMITIPQKVFWAMLIIIFIGLPFQFHQKYFGGNNENNKI